MKKLNKENYCENAIGVFSLEYIWIAMQQVY